MQNKYTQYDILITKSRLTKAENDTLLSYAQGLHNADKQLKKWHDVCKKNGVAYIDFELIRIYRRYVVVGALAEQEHELAKNAILQMKMSDLAEILNNNFEMFQQNIYNDLSEEKGQAFLKMTSKSILKNIQFKLSDLLEEN